LLSAFTACPGLFYPTPAQDGILYRLRIPGGILNVEQLHAIAEIADKYGGGYIDVTNRANIQIREIKIGIDNTVFSHLQVLGIGSINPKIDHIRNIMTSPTAGIDKQELIDTRPLVKAWDEYLSLNSQLGGLSAKFSVGFDGGGQVGICHNLNDITFVAGLVAGRVYFRLCLSFGEKGKPARDTGILLTPEACLPVLAALATVYLEHTDTTVSRKPRLREVINHLGLETYLQTVQQRLTGEIDITPVSHSQRLFSPTAVTPTTQPDIGIHPQKQPGLFYIGVVLPLGRLETMQMRGLAEIAAKYAISSIRLTPGQNLLVADIAEDKVAEVEREIINLGLTYSPTHINNALVACSGKRGCTAAATETKDHALTLAKYIETHLNLDRPVNIHFSGCRKSCAQHDQADITLLGVTLEVDNQAVEGYQVYLGDENLQKFGRQLYEYVTFAELPKLVERMLRVYRHHRLTFDESFQDFSKRYAIAQLKELFS
jgi:ferredoxin-nitrite reductase